MAAPETITVPSPSDFHCHLRQGAMCALVTPLVEQGGISTCLVMPNLQPPITTVDQAVSYRAELQRLAPSVHFLMTLYLSPSLTPDEICKASKAGITGVKSYPRGVTTNSDGGIESYEAYYPVFKAMEEENMILNLHGEVPSSEENGITVLNAEEAFLPQLDKLVKAFPRLRIVVEHATTRAAVEKVKLLPDTVACSITAHHLQLIVDDWAGQGFNYCKPVAKKWEDRAALRDVIKSGHPRFFLGSDSAPHPLHNKLPTPPTHDASTNTHTPACGCAAGLFTSPILLPLTAHLLESFGALDQLEAFTSTNGRKFYQLSEEGKASVTLRRTKEDGGVVPVRYTGEGTEGEKGVVPFWAGKRLGWEVVRE